jgi:ABC-type transport system involved in multi-copper enzyme maturation permease subunit
MMATETAVQRPIPKAPGFLTSALRVFDLSVGEMLWSRRTIFMALVVGAPVLISVILRLIDALGLPVFRVNGNTMPGPAIFGLMIWVFYLRFTVPVLGVFYGTSLIADEVEDKTITYLFTRPIRRGAVLLGKFLAYFVCTVMVVLPSLMIVYFLMGLSGATLAGTFPSLLKDLGLIMLGLLAYGGLFAWVGAQFKRPLVIGLVFVFGFEQVALIIPGYIRHLTVSYYLQSLVPHAVMGEGVISLLQSLVQQKASLATSLVMLIAIGVVFVFLAMRVIARREYVLEQ